MEEKERIALLLCQAEEEHSRLVPQELCPHSLVSRETLYSQTGVSHRIKAITVLYSFFCKVQRGGVPDKIGCVEGLRWSSVLTLMSLCGPLILMFYCYSSLDEQL